MNKNSKEFRKLQAEWYKKAEQSGYEDIEKSNGDLKRPSEQLFHKNRNNSNRYDYFRLLEQYRLRGHRQFRKFSKVQRACFNLHAAGYSLRESEKILKSGTGAYKSLKFTGSYITIKRLIDPVIAACMTWHKESTAGLLSPSNVDMIVEDVMINERQAYYDTTHESFSESQAGQRQKH